MKRFLRNLGFFLVLLLAACSSEPKPTTPAAVTQSAPQPTPASATSEPLPTPSSAPSPSPLPTPSPYDEFASLREVMVLKGVIDWGIEDEAVIDAMGTVPRHEFVPSDYISQAYENHPLPIGYGQTISQPYIVALMTQAAGISAGDKVLEIGTGSGYQAAVLAELVDQVYTVEIISPLYETAGATLSRLGYDNVTLRHADGYFGWEEHAPFDAIVVTAAPDHIPGPLVQQLKIGGRLIIPVGPIGGVQTLWQVTRISEEEVRTENLGGVRFVPLTRDTR